MGACCPHSRITFRYLPAQGGVEEGEGRREAGGIITSVTYLKGVS